MKPWMLRRPRESVEEWNARMYRTCFACGTECTNTTRCDEHEETCPKAHTRGRPKKKGDT